MRVRVFKCDGPGCSALSETAEGWVRQGMEPYPRTGFQPYCEMVNPAARTGSEMLFIFLSFCGVGCQRAWWVKHERECGCHTRYMSGVLIKLPSGEFLTSGEVVENFGRFGWPGGAEWVCGNCRGPVYSSYGEWYCEDPVCHSETEPAYSVY